MPARTAAAGLVALLMGLVIAPSVSAAGTLDQSQTTLNSGSVAVAQANVAGQTFTAGITGLLDQVDIAVQQFGSPGDLTVQIRVVLPDGTPSPVVLATAQVPVASVSSTLTFVSVPLTPPAVSVAGTQYAIVLIAPLAGTGSIYRWGLAAGDLYPAGRQLLSITAGATWTFNDPGFDAGFRTYVTPNPVVPEVPLAVVLPIAGLVVIGLGFVLTRKQRHGSDLI
jgi:hypothetical protein